MPGLYTGAQGVFGGFAGLLYGTSLSTPPSLLADALFGSGTPAGNILNSELSGFAVNFISSPANILARPYPNNSLGSYSGTPFQRDGGLITFSRASLATVVDSGGKIKWAPHNLLLASEQFDSASWTVSGGITVTANNQVAPNGTTTADTASLTSAGYRYQNVTTGLVTGATITASMWLWTKTGKATIVLRVAGNATGSDESKTVIALTTTPTLYTVTRTFTSTDTIVTFGIDNRTGIGGDGIAGEVIVWGAHLYRSDLGGMQPNASAYPFYNPTTPKNLLGHTDAFSTSPSWSVSGVSILPNALSAPNGFLSADTMTAVSGAGSHRILSSAVTIPSGTPVVMSVYLKAGTHSFVQIHDGSSASYFANFNLSTGATGTVTGCTAAITAVGNGWYRCSISMTLNVANPVMGIALVSSATAARNESWTAVGTETVYLWGAQLSNSASLDAYVPTIGAAPTAAAYHGPRLDYDPVTLVAKGLLVEEQRTNLLLQSNAFKTSPWTPSGTMSGTQNAAGPDGVANSAWTLTDSSGTNVSYYLQAATIQNNSNSVTASIYILKTFGAATFPGFGMLLTGGTFVYAEYTVNTNTGAAVAKTTNTGTSSAKVTNAGTFWRVEITSTNNSTGNVTASVYIAPSVNTDGSATWSVATTGSCVAYGAMLDFITGGSAAFATSYIPTTSASVTRSADVASVGTSQFPYSSTEGTWVAGFQTIFTTTNPASTGIINFDGSANKLAIYMATGVNYTSTFDGTLRINATGAVTASASKSASAYDGTGRYIVSNGGTVASGTIASGYTSVSSVGLGGSSGIGSLNGWIRQITYIPRRLTNAELQARTA